MQLAFIKCYIWRWLMWLLAANCCEADHEVKQFDGPLTVSFLRTPAGFQTKHSEKYPYSAKKNPHKHISDGTMCFQSNDWKENQLRKMLQDRNRGASLTCILWKLTYVVSSSVNVLTFESEACWGRLQVKGCRRHSGTLCPMCQASDSCRINPRRTLSVWYHPITSKHLHLHQPVGAHHTSQHVSGSEAGLIDVKSCCWNSSF